MKSSVLIEYSLSVVGLATGKLAGEGDEVLVHLVGGGVPARQGDDAAAVVGEQGGKSGDTQPRRAAEVSLRGRV